MEADDYIKVLERQLDEYRNDNANLRERDTSRASLDELYDRVVNARNQSLEQPSRREATNNLDIDKIIEAKLETARRAEQGKTNLELVREKIREKIGENYQDNLKKRIEYLDLTQEEADTMAATKPKTFLKMLGLDTQTDTFQAPVSNTNVSSTQNAQPKRTWSYYQQMKKENPKEYYKPQTNLQMLNDYQELGTDFEDGNFKQYGDTIKNRYVTVQ